jgi:hypothetical protein
MLKITDLTTSKEMDSKEMTGVRGGMKRFPFFDSSTSIDNKVADITQGFNFALAQGNEGAVVNNQEIYGGNGNSWSPVDQSQYQDNWMDLSHIGNVSVS